MHIAIDLRSLSTGTISGVENYTINLLEQLLKLDSKNKYTLFYNSWKKRAVQDLFFVNSQVIYRRWPNKLLNAGLMTGAVSLERLLGPFDCLFMPNLNQFAIGPKVKLALTVHDMSPVITPEFYDLKRRLWHSLLGYRTAFKRANVLFAVSEHTKQDMVRLFNVPKEKITVAYPGVDHSVFRPGIEDSRLREVRNTYGLPGDYLLFLNTLEPRKNAKALIDAFELLKGDVSLVIAGRKGWKYRNIFKRIRQSKKSRYIKYLDYVPEADKPPLIAMARALVYPSFYEGFGFQPLEAMALGTPVVASSVTSIPEVVGDAGLLVNPYNVDELRTALQSLLSGSELKNRLVRQGLLRAKQFTWEKTARTVLDSLNALEP